jgi:hypothetical protein
MLRTAECRRKWNALADICGPSQHTSVDKVAQNTQESFPTEANQKEVNAFVPNIQIDWS